MPTTTNYNLPYPSLTEAPNGPGQIQGLAVAVDTTLFANTGGKPLFVGISAAAQSIADSVNVPLTLDTNVLDTASGHSTSVNPSRYTFQKAGDWRCEGKFYLTAGGSVGRRSGVINRNGTSIPASDVDEVPTNQQISVRVFSTILTGVSVGEYAELNAFQVSGGALNTLAGFTVFQAEWLRA